MPTYAVPGTVWHVSIGVDHRAPVLTDPDLADAIVESIEFQCTKTNSDLLLYCVMPDHLHLVIAIGEGGDLVAIVRDFKSYTTTFWRKRSGQSVLWQDSFYDHGVRKSERMDDLVAYVVENPVKAGIVQDWRDYQWIGGRLVCERD